MTEVLANNHSKQLSQSLNGLPSEDFRLDEKLNERIQEYQRNGEKTYLEALEQIRREHRQRLALVERDYYKTQLENTNKTNEQTENVISSKPPLPKTTKRSTSPEFATEQRSRDRQHLSRSTNVIREHDDQVSFCPHRTVTGNSTVNVRDLSTEEIRRRIRAIRKEIGLTNSLNTDKNPNQTTLTSATSWAGRITVPEPFDLSNSGAFDTIHRVRCSNDIEATKLKKEIDDELHLQYKIQVKAVPSHVHVPLYELLQEEQRRRREESFQATKEYFRSISKPFDFEYRERAKVVLRRHSFSVGDLRSERDEHLFRARPIPEFYNRKNGTKQKFDEETTSRSIQRKVRAEELLRQSRSPFSKKRTRRMKRSMSLADLKSFQIQEHSFRPKINNYYLPDFDKLQTQFFQSIEDRKQKKSPTRSKPFVFLSRPTSLKKQKIIEQIQKEQEEKHLKSMQVKGKPVKKRTPAVDRSESIPTKSTTTQLLRKSKVEEKKSEEKHRAYSAKISGISRSMNEKSIRQIIQKPIDDENAVARIQLERKKREKLREMRQGEAEYAQRLEQIKERVQKQPLLMQRDLSKAKFDFINKEIEKAIKNGGVTNDELEQFDRSTQN